MKTGSICLVNWCTDLQVPVTVKPVDASRNLFSQDRTYWLVGLAGNLGRSICDWMAKQGAKYIVVTSRSPKVPQEWISLHKTQGVTVASVAGYNQDLHSFCGLAMLTMIIEISRRGLVSNRLVNTLKNYTRKLAALLMGR